MEILPFAAAEFGKICNDSSTNLQAFFLCLVSEFVRYCCWLTKNLILKNPQNRLQFREEHGIIVSFVAIVAKICL